MQAHASMKTWKIENIAPGVEGDHFAVVASTTLSQRYGGGTVGYDVTVVARGLFRDRCFLGAVKSDGHEHHIAVLDQEGGEPLLVVAHSRGDAPLEAYDFATRTLRWSSRELGAAYVLTPRAGQRALFVRTRDRAMVVNADTGKYRRAWRGDIDAIAINSDGAIVAKQSRRMRRVTHTLTLYRPPESASGNVVAETTSDGEAYDRETDLVTSDLLLLHDRVVVAGYGLRAFAFDGTQLWRWGTDYTSAVRVAIGSFFRAMSEGGIADVDDEGKVTRVRPWPHGMTMDDAQFLGSEHWVGQNGVVTTIDGDAVWDFRGALEACAEEALRTATTPDETVGATAKAGDRERSPKRVRHARYGDGTLLLQRDDKVTVRFDDGTERTLAQAFVESIT
jgi:hypothetical protein